MITKAFALLCLPITVLLITGLVQAQQSKKIARLGYLSDSSPARESARADAIRRSLHDLGYIERENIATEYRYAEGKVDRAPELAAELVRLNVDVIVIAGGDTQVRAAKNATSTIPIVMVGQGADPVETGLVKSLARPGGNVTGITLLNRELGGKRLELLKEAVPKLARVGVLYDPVNVNNERELKKVLPVAARALGLIVQPWEVRDAENLDKQFVAMANPRPDGLYVTGGRQMEAIQKQTAAFALKSRLPSIYGISNAVNTGFLMYYGADLAYSYRRVAYYIDKILRGTKPADLPVEQPKKFEFVVNLNTAKQIGLTIPPNVLARADKVIK
jgi:putative tryptophan/tyrosine transport system substrate-binding protein